MAGLDGPQVALAAIDRLEDKLAGYHAYHAIRAAGHKAPRPGVLRNLSRQLMTKVRIGPDCASIGLAQEALAG